MLSGRNSNLVEIYSQSIPSGFQVSFNQLEYQVQVRIIWPSSKSDELIFRLIEKEAKQEKIFDAVINFYKTLESGEAKNIEISLREFE